MKVLVVPNSTLSVCVCSERKVCSSLPTKYLYVKIINFSVTLHSTIEPDGTVGKCIFSVLLLHTVQDQEMTVLSRELSCTWP